MPRSSAEIVRRSRRESFIEGLLYRHPELLDPSLPRGRRQVLLSPRSRADLLFEDDQRLVLVEIKRGVVTRAAVEQILRYRDLVAKSSLKFTGYLIGTSISVEAFQMLKASRGVLKFRRTGYDIPREIVLCRGCRRARDSRLSQSPCKFCGDKGLVH